MGSSPSYPQIYTDASKTNSGVAIAIINGNQSISYKLPDHNSIYTAEYFALLEGVHLAIQLPDSTINICTDLLSALNNLKYNLHSSTLAIKISNTIKKANKNIRFIWTPGYCEINGNEKADKVARETVNNPLTEIRTYFSLIDIHRNVSTICTNLWESEWRRTLNNKLK
jgi:ribonuclease HI